MNQPFRPACPQATISGATLERSPGHVMGIQRLCLFIYLFFEFPNLLVPRGPIRLKITIVVSLLSPARRDGDKHGEQRPVRQGKRFNGEEKKPSLTADRADS